MGADSLEAEAIRANREDEVFPHPTSIACASARPRRVTLFCAEAFRPAACCVEDALVARGWKVALHTGDAVRPVLRRLLRARVPGLLVVCVPESVDCEAAANLRAGLDPDGRGDLHIVSFETPRSVIEAVERIDGAKTRRVTRQRQRRTYLAHPTMVEQQVGRPRTGLMALGTAATIAMLFVAFETRAPRVASSPIAPALVEPHEQPPASLHRIDQTVLSSARVRPAWPDEEPDDAARPAPKPIDVRPVPQCPSRVAAHPESRDAIEATTRKPAPVEDGGDRGTATARSAVREVASDARYVLDPFVEL